MQVDIMTNRSFLLVIVYIAIFCHSGLFMYFGVARNSDTKVSIFGGRSATPTPLYYNDVWTYNIFTRSWINYRKGGLENEFPPYVPSSLGSHYPKRVGDWEEENRPIARIQFCMDAINDHMFYIFGGLFHDQDTAATTKTHDLWYFDSSDSRWARAYGSTARKKAQWIDATKGQFVSTESPGSRNGAICAIFEDRYILVATGSNMDSYFMDDVYEFDMQTGLWAWMAGTKSLDGYFAETDFGNFNPSNHPWGLETAVGWKKNDNEMMLFSGYAMIGLGDKGYISSVWTYRRSDKAWAWNGGPLAPDEFTRKGDKLVYSNDTGPGGRRMGNAVMINDDEVWMFGGSSPGGFSEQDVMIYSISKNAFKYIGGNIYYEYAGNYYTPIDTYSTNDRSWPGSRYGSVSILGKPNEVIVFMGLGLGKSVSQGKGRLSDVWTFQYCPSSCGVNAICKNAECQCPPLYSGDPKVRCRPQCSPTCNSHATCTPPSTCTCVNGFVGDGFTCTPVCDAPPCSSLETCSLPNTCDCVTGYSGVPCRPVCSGCAVNAECTLPGVCSCLAGYTGDPLVSCTNSHSCPGGCHADATCVGNNTCQCRDGYSGDGLTCSPICTDPLPCHPNATCETPDECVCNTGFSGVGYFQCDPVCQPCGVNAKCTEPNKCTCDAGFTGNPLTGCAPKCDVECDVDATCETPNNCVCNEGFVGDGLTCSPECLVDYFMGVSGSCEAECRGTSNCAPDNSVCESPGVCKCVGDFSGDPYEKCEFACAGGCGVNAECVDVDVCECRPYGYVGDAKVQCDAVCSPSCAPANSICSKPNRCYCEDGYTGPERDAAWVACLPICVGNDTCVDHATCTLPGECTCNVLYEGDGKIECFPKCEPKCISRAECIAPNVCACKDDFIGDGKHCRTIGLEVYELVLIIAGCCVVALCIFVVITVAVVINLVCLKKHAPQIFESELQPEVLEDVLEMDAFGSAPVDMGDEEGSGSGSTASEESEKQKLEAGKKQKDKDPLIEKESKKKKKKKKKDKDESEEDEDEDDKKI